MTREEFIDKLKTLNLSKKDFSDITTVPYSTVNQAVKIKLEVYTNPNQTLKVNYKKHSFTKNINT